jgi:C-methyltransferase
MSDATTTRPTGSATGRPVIEPGLPPHALLWDLATVAAVSRCLHAVAQHGVADAVAAQGSTVDEVAERLDLDADALGRVLRALAAYGVFDVDLPVVRHTDASRLLRADHPMSMGAFAHMMGLPMSWDSLSALPATLETGRAGVFDLDPGGLFSYLHDFPDQAAVFDRAMTAKSHADIPLVLGAFDFAAHRGVADVGGGRGHLLRALTERHPGIEATLVDLPDVIGRVSESGEPGVDRLRLLAADFFADVLPVADVYVLMEIIHDWDDADAVRILANIRRSAPDGATVLIVETVLDDRHRRDPAKTLDIVMLALTGGRERTPAEHAALLGAAGFELTRVIPTGGGVQVVEARATPSSPDGA